MWQAGIFTFRRFDTPERMAKRVAMQEELHRQFTKAAPRSLPSAFVVGDGAVAGSWKRAA